jgi:hypothetical protein
MTEDRMPDIFETVLDNACPVCGERNEAWGLCDGCTESAAHALKKVVQTVYAMYAVTEDAQDDLDCIIEDLQEDYHYNWDVKEKELMR